MKSWLTRWLKKIKPEGMPDWLWGAILLGVILLAAVMVQQLVAAPAERPAQDPLGGAGFVFDLILALLLLMGFLFLGLYVVRRWQRGGSGAASRRLQILESRHLSPKQAVHIIRAGERCLLIGATDHGISLIAELEPDETQDGLSEAATGSFAEELEQRTTTSEEDWPGNGEMYSSGLKEKQG